MILRILETEKARTVTLDGEVIAGPGGRGRVVAEFAVKEKRLTEVLSGPLFSSVSESR